MAMFQGSCKSSNAPLQENQVKVVQNKWITEKVVNESVMCQLDSKKNGPVSAFNACTVYCLKVT